MAQDRDVNLLPEEDRRAGDEAVKKAVKKPQERDIKLVVPALDAPQKKTGMFKRMFGKNNAASQPAATQVPASGSAAPAPKPAPVPEAAEETKHWWESRKKQEKTSSSSSASRMMPPAPRPSSTTSPKPAPSPAPKPAAKPAVPTFSSQPSAAPLKPASKNASQKGKMHEPEADVATGGPNVNLVPEYVKAEMADRSWVAQASVAVFVLAFWVILSGIAIARVKRAEAQMTEIQARLTQVNAAVKHYEEEKPAEQALQKQFTSVESVLNGHIYWTPLLQKLEDTTIPDVYYVSMTAANTGDVRLKAVAKTYTAAARQIRAFERATNFVQKVEVHQASLLPQPKAKLPVPVVAFDIQLTLTPDSLQIDIPQEQKTTAP